MPSSDSDYKPWSEYHSCNPSHSNIGGDGLLDPYLHMHPEFKPKRSVRETLLNETS